MSAHEPSELVLGMYPFTRGITFALFEGPLSPIDWGFKRPRGGDHEITAFEMAKRLIDDLQPDVVALPARAAKCGPHARRSDRLIARIVSYAASQVIGCHRATRSDIRACFRPSGAVTRYEIAETIAAHIPALDHRLPPARKCWQTEDERMGLFDAASLVMTYFSSVPGPAGPHRIEP